MIFVFVGFTPNLFAKEKLAFVLIFDLGLVGLSGTHSAHSLPSLFKKYNHGKWSKFWYLNRTILKKLIQLCLGLQTNRKKKLIFVVVCFQDHFFRVHAACVIFSIISHTFVYANSRKSPNGQIYLMYIIEKSNFVYECCVGRWTVSVTFHINDETLLRCRNLLCSK